MDMQAPTKPLVYSCSGCSSAAQVANSIALRLTREQVAEMSCIAGVGGRVKPLVNIATSGRPVVSIDGCSLHCAKACLEAVGVTPSISINLGEWGIKKKLHEDYCAAEAASAYARVKAEIETNLTIDAST